MSSTTEICKSANIKHKSLHDKIIDLNVAPFVGVHSNSSSGQESSQDQHWEQCIQENILNFLQSYLQNIPIHQTFSTETKPTYNTQTFIITKSGNMNEVRHVQWNTQRQVTFTFGLEYERKNKSRRLYFTVKVRDCPEFNHPIRDLVMNTFKKNFTKVCLKNAEHTFTNIPLEKPLPQVYIQGYPEDDIDGMYDHTLALFPKQFLILKDSVIMDEDNMTIDFQLYEYKYNDKTYFNQQYKWADLQAEDKILATLMATHSRLGENSRIGQALDDLAPIIAQEYMKQNIYTSQQVIDIMQTLRYAYARF